MNLKNSTAVNNSTNAYGRVSWKDFFSGRKVSQSSCLLPRNWYKEVYVHYGQHPKVTRPPLKTDASDNPARELICRIQLKRVIRERATQYSPACILILYLYLQRCRCQNGKILRQLFENWVVLPDRFIPGLAEPREHHFSSNAYNMIIFSIVSFHSHVIYYVYQFRIPRFSSDVQENV